MFFSIPFTSMPFSKIRLQESLNDNLFKIIVLLKYESLHLSISLLENKSCYFLERLHGSNVVYD